ncbi:MAG: HET-C-related protein [Pseudomonas sp.]
MNPHQQYRSLHQVLPLTGELQSSFAMDQLTALARRTEPAHFIMQMATIFGLDIPPSAYYKLHQALLGAAIQPARYLVVSAGVSEAEYDNRDRTVRISATALENPSQDPRHFWKILAILLHEFGHHIDTVLRQDLMEKKQDGSLPVNVDAPMEEGSRYAYFMSVVDLPAATPQQIACITATDGTQTSFSVNCREAMEIIRLSQDEIRHLTQKGDGNTESFEAGGDHGTTHESLSKVLTLMSLRQSELNAIYFGNWLRDHSQLLDPKLVRAPNEPKSFFQKFSRDALTSIVDILAARKFSDDRVFYRDVFTVTREKLGVYRPSQHIDNPKIENPTPKDPSTIDTDFEPWVEPGNPWLEIDHASSMKRYLFRSIGVMQEELGAAVDAGPSPEGFRWFGAGLHILEDFYAHSNFVELSLIKLGYDKVKPWTSKADCRWGLPLVTGRYGASDVIASLALPIAQVLAPIKSWTFSPTKRGERSQGERMLLVLFGELNDPTPLNALEALLSLRDDLADNPVFTVLQLQTWLVGIPLRVIGNTLGFLIQHLAKWIANSVDDIQTMGSDPNIDGSTDPTHSQLSKDHDDHPFHDLAAQLAQEAVRKVATAMNDAWNGPRAPDLQGRYSLQDNPMAIATELLVHPQDSAWQDDIVREWALANPQFTGKSSNAGKPGVAHSTAWEFWKDELEQTGQVEDVFVRAIVEYANFYSRTNTFLTLADLQPPIL